MINLRQRHSTPPSVCFIVLFDKHLCHSFLWTALQPNHSCGWQKRAKLMMKLLWILRVGVVQAGRPEIQVLKKNFLFKLTIPSNFKIGNSNHVSHYSGCEIYLFIQEKQSLCMIENFTLSVLPHCLVTHRYTQCVFTFFILCHSIEMM